MLSYSTACNCLQFWSYEICRQYDKVREEALTAQWDECERLKQEAIEEAITSLRLKLQREFQWQRERAIADALEKQRVIQGPIRTENFLKGNSFHLT